MAGIGANAAGSPLYLNQTAVGPSVVRVPTRDHHGKFRFGKVSVTVNADTGTGTGGAVVNTDEINLIQLPANARLLLGLCQIKFSASQGASTTVDMGHRAYRDRGGVLVAEDPDSVLDGWDATTTALEAFPVSAGALGTNVDVLQTLTWDSQGPITIFMKALDSGGTYDGDLGDTYDFMFVYVTD